MIWLDIIISTTEDILTDHIKRQQDEKQRLEKEIEEAGLTFTK
jgi:hypothetical protein